MYLKFVLKANYQWELPCQLELFVFEKKETFRN